MNSRQVRSTLFWRRFRPDRLAASRLTAEHERCPVCQGRRPWFTLTGLDPAVHGAEQLELDCVCQIPRFEREVSDLVARTNRVPSQARLKTLDELVPYGNDPGKWQEVAELIDDLKSLALTPWEHKWIFVQGAKGNGKTHMLLAVQHYLLPDLSAYVYADELGNRIFAELKNDSLDHFINDLVAVPILLIDDLGTEATDRNDFILLHVSNILNRRFQEGVFRPTVITTNLIDSELLARYDRLFSRLWDLDLVRRYLLQLPDHRPPPKADTAGEIVPEDHTGFRGSGQ